MDVIIYHNPDCGTSCNRLALFRMPASSRTSSSILKTPRSRAMLVQFIARMGISARKLLREKGTPYAEFGPGEPSLTDEQLLEAMLAYPILINRPIVVSAKGVRLCRPSEEVLELLPPQLGEFTKEDGERVIDEHSRRVATA
jgi:arsenate reductase